MQVSAHVAYRSGIWKLYPGIGNICGSFVCNIGNWLVSKHQHIMAAEQYLLYLQWVKEWIIAIMIILILVGWIIITLRL